MSEIVKQESGTPPAKKPEAETMPTSFGAAAQKLTTNPLSIIGLFVAFTEAALIGLCSSSNLSDSNRWVLLLVVCFFPVMIFLSFLYLVVNHHTKLYAPKDFHDAEGFHRVLSSEQQREKIAAEGAELVESRVEASAPSQQNSQEPVRNSALPVSESTEEPRPGLQFPPFEPRETYLIAETLALNEFEADLGHPLSRNVRLGDRGVDALFNHRGRTGVVEVKLVPKSNPDGPITRALRQLANFKASPKADANTDLILLAVTENSTEVDRDRIAERIARIANDLKITVQSRVMDLKRLRQKYGLAN